MDVLFFNILYCTYTICVDVVSYFSFYYHFPDFTLSLRLTEVRIPNHTVRNSTARLECHYNMDGQDLYSVKWYKDGHEFYRYVPGNMPPALVFPLPGVRVDVSSIYIYITPRKSLLTTE